MLSGAGAGPWIMGYLEAGLWGADVVESTEPSIKHAFVTAMVKGDSGPSPGHWAIKGGDATAGDLTVYWDGPRPTRAARTKRFPNGTDAPMKKQGSIILGIGGDNSNGAVGTFYVRAADGIALAELKTRVKNCFEAGALASGCDVEIQWALGDYLEIKDCWPLAERYKANAEGLGRSFFPLEKIPTTGAGSTDMGNVSHRVPSIHPMIACAPPHVVIHNPEFAKYAGSETGDAAVLDGAKALAMTAIDVMTDDQLLKDARDQFNETADLSAQAVAQAWHGDGDAALGGCGCC